MTDKIESQGEYEKNEMLKQAKKHGIKFEINDGKKDNGLDIINCNKRTLYIDKKGRLIFKQEETVPLIWTLLMTFLGTLVPSFMFLESNIKMRIIAVIIFIMFQIGAIATVNLARPEIRIFDKSAGRYFIRRANHLLTMLFRKTYLDILALNNIDSIQLSSFKAKRWEMKRLGTGDNEYTTQNLKTYENYRLVLNTFDGKEIVIYDWYNLDHSIDLGEKIAEYLAVEFTLD